MGFLLSFTLYNFIIVPLLFIGLHLAAFFNKKLRQGIIGRYKSYRQLRASGLSQTDTPKMVIHCASMGEFEHIKSFLIEFKKLKPNWKIVVLFFSPSGYENVREFAAVDLFLYSPFDWILPVWRFMHILKPKLWIVAKHDVWPNQVWLAHWQKIPIFLINASLHAQSSRLLWFTRPFHREVYGKFTRILAVSHPDQSNFLKLAPGGRIVVVGDTKYDQVIYRRDESQKRQIIPEKILKNRWVLVAGSTWPEDQKHLIPAMQAIAEEYPQFLAIICPHEPTPHHLAQLTEQLHPREPVLLSRIQEYSNQSFIVIDRVGVLANLYGLGKVAYVGGSFKQNVHNVLEPAVYGIPVLFGPINQNSYEAQLLKISGGGLEIRNGSEFESIIKKFMVNDIYRVETGQKAFRVVESNRGATRRTVELVAGS
ncbi:MAG: glycosyltransferase N-terminal domain-containing protein [Calditrichia bacterium]